MFPHSVAHLCGSAVLDEIRDLHHQSNGITAQMLVCIAEADEQRLYAADGYSSMYAWCVAELNLSEDAACDRMDAAKLGRRFPALMRAVADGRLHLTAVLMLARRLTRENVDELIEAAAGRSKAQISVMLAEKFPRPDWPTREVVLAGRESQTVEPEPFTSGAAECLVEPPAPQSVQERNVLSVPERIEPVPPGRKAVLSPGRIGHQFTVSEDWQRKLERLKDLAIHRTASRDIVDVLEFAMDVAIAQLERRKFAATEKPRAPRPNTSSDPRHIPADVKHAVYARDGGRCTFVSDDGQRCESRRVEYDHEIEVARGGESTVENLRLRCRTHNQHAAEKAFGRGFMENKRETARARRANAIARALEARRAQEREDAAALERARAECATPEQARAHLDRVWALLDHAANVNPTTTLESSP